MYGEKKEAFEHEISLSISFMQIWIMHLRGKKTRDSQTALSTISFLLLLYGRTKNFNGIFMLVRWIFFAYQKNYRKNNKIALYSA
jgi:hypothetical protein